MQWFERVSLPEELQLEISKCSKPPSGTPFRERPGTVEGDGNTSGALKNNRKRVLITEIPNLRPLNEEQRKAQGTYLAIFPMVSRILCSPAIEIGLIQVVAGFSPVLGLCGED